MVCFKLEKSVKEIRYELTSANPNGAPNRFNKGIEGLEDQDRLGAPITTKMPHNIKTVRQIIDDDPHISLHQSEAQTSLSYGTIETIIFNQAQKKKQCPYETMAVAFAVVNSTFPFI